MSEKPRICLVLDDRERRVYQHSEIRSLLENGYEIPLVLVDSSFEPQDDVDLEGGLPTQLVWFVKWMASGKFSALIYAERKVAELINPSSAVAGEVAKLKLREDVRKIEGLEESEFVEFSPIKTGEYTYEFPDEMIDKITDTADVVVLLGFNKILRGRILTAPEHGVLSFHGSDIRRYRGRPPGFFQYINDEDEIGVTLQQLTEELDGGKLVLCEHADISDATSWHEVQLRIYETYGSLLVRGLENLQEESFTPETPDELGELTYQSEGDKLGNVAKCFKRNITRRYIE